MIGEDDEDLPDDDDFSSFPPDNDPGVFSIMEDEQSDIQVKLELRERGGDVCVAVLTDDKMASRESSTSPTELFIVLKPEDASLFNCKGLDGLVIPTGLIFVKKFCKPAGILRSEFFFLFVGIGGGMESTCLP